MYLWDTHAIVWGVEESEEMSDRARRAAVEGGDMHLASAISLWEIALLVHKGRVRLHKDLRSWFEQMESGVRVLPITSAIAIRAYELEDFHGDPADRIIAATALEHDLTIVTRDNKLRQHPALTCLW